MAIHKSVRLALAIFALSANLAAAADLAPDDYRYLSATYGLGPHSDVVVNLNDAERSSLHDLIAGFKNDSSRRDEAVRDRLYEAYARECEAWGEAHGHSGCGPARDPAAEPGKLVADRICNECHLFGSGLAPSFFRLAQGRTWDADAVATALRSSHDMVPIALPPEERVGLAAYINSFREEPQRR